MRTHLDLYGWEVRRAGNGWFHLWLRGGTFPAAGGPLTYIVAALRKALAS